MKRPLTIRLERQQRLALDALAKQRQVSVGSLAAEAVDEFLRGQQHADIGRLVEELRASAAEQAEANRKAIAEQRELFADAQKKNADQHVKVLEAQQRVMQPLIAAINGEGAGSGGGPPMAPTSSPEPLVMGAKNKKSL